MSHFIKGLVIGFSIAAPVGPIGLLCLRRSLTDGKLVGFLSGLGAATADTLYGAVAALGLTLVTELIARYHTPLQFFGGAFLILLGVKIIRAPAFSPGDRPAHARSLPIAYASIFVLTLANPVTIIAFAGVFAGFGLGWESGGDWQAGWLIFGVFTGSSAWWLFLSSFAGWFGHRLNPQVLHRINLCAGLLIASFGLWQLVNACV